MDANVELIKELIITLVKIEVNLREGVSFFTTFVIISWAGRIIAFFIKRSDSLYYYRKQVDILKGVKDQNENNQS